MPVPERAVFRHVQAEVPVGALSRHTAAGGALEVALLQQVWLVHVLDRLGVLADRGGEGLQTDRTSAELVGDRAQQAAVALVESGVVHLERGERFARDREGDIAVVSYLRVIPYPFEPAIRDPWCSAGAKGDLTRGRGVDLDLQDARRSAHHLFERLRLEEIEVVNRSESIAERRGEPTDSGRRPDERETR